VLYDILYAIRNTAAFRNPLRLKTRRPNAVENARRCWTRAGQVS
jgi:hypothetical protein